MKSKFNDWLSNFLSEETKKWQYQKEKYQKHEAAKDGLIGKPQHHKLVFAHNVIHPNYHITPARNVGITKAALSFL